MRAVLFAYEVTDRRVWAADSIEGLPPPDERFAADDGALWHENAVLAVSLDQVKANFAKYGLHDCQVQFLKGGFKDTLPSAPIDKLAILRLDGDMYGSTMDALTSLYQRVSPGGFVIVDDYGQVETCREAISDFRKQQDINDPLLETDFSEVYWRKSRVT